MQSRWFPIIFIGFMLLFAWSVYEDLPALVPVHFGIDGQPDRYADPLTAVLIGPAVGTLVFAAALTLGERSALGDRMTRSAFRFITTSVMALLAFLHVATLGTALGWAFDPVRLIIGAVGVLFGLMGTTFASLQPNRWFGIRTPWTLLSDEVWRRTHRLGGRLYTGLGLVMLAAAVLMPLESAFWVVLGGTALVTAASMGYSYFVWRSLIGKPAHGAARPENVGIS